MKGIQSKTMFNTLKDIAAKNKKQVTVAQKPSLNRTQVEAGVNAVKEMGGELAVPSAGTFRAYAGIDTPMETYSKNFPKH